MNHPITVTYVGGPTVIFDIGGLRIMTDPTLDPPGDFPAGPGDIIRKTIGPAVTDIGKIDMVLLSHDQHADNLDAAGRMLVEKVATTISTKSASQRLKGSVTGLLPWEQFSVKAPSGVELVITATPARHGPAHSEKIVGEVIGFILSVKDATPVEIYLTGDTVFYAGIEKVAERFTPRYVFIFAGAATPRIPISLTMDTNDAIDTAAAFSEAIIIPVHFEGWSHYKETGKMLSDTFSALGIGNRLKILEPGVQTILQ
jgi:L-ascorbate metabolism protein UlaG (beta-lactamase superfamily)